ncbi:MAG: helix-turn-helix domain-containing protein [Phycisphaerales bacterium]
MHKDAQSGQGKSRVEQGMVRPRARRRRFQWQPAAEITIDEIRSAIDATAFPAILTIGQAASMLQLSPHTLYKAVSEGRYRDAVRRGKPLRFWRDRLIQAYFSR